MAYCSIFLHLNSKRYSVVLLTFWPEILSRYTEDPLSRGRETCCGEMFAGKMCEFRKAGLVSFPVAQMEALVTDEILVLFSIQGQSSGLFVGSAL